MSSRIFSLVEVETENESFLIINGRWWAIEHDPGHCWPDQDELSFGWDESEPCDYVRPCEFSEMDNIKSIKSYRLKVSMCFKDATDHIERDIAKYILLEEVHELLAFERLDV